jgi:hypothetical protein
MKPTALTLLLVCLSAYLFAQNPYTVSGSVTDTAATYKMVNTTIALLHQKDSTLVKFTRANAEGTFSFGNLKPGKFILMVTYPGYADYIENFTLDSLAPDKKFGPINLILKATLLNDVIIKGKVAAIKIKGDTTEFNAGSYTIEANSKVEDLLRQLPGIQVDKDGKITAQGQKVNKVLVDGEEFFGDDPTLVTKNIRGDMVDKVQLYDKKSDQATFTGIDDGEKSKTINIQLKEDKKKGYFGKLDGGPGTGKFYEAQAMYNLFGPKQKVSAFGAIGNTGKVGLGWQDGSAGAIEIAGGVITERAGGDDLESFGGQYDGNGIPLAKTAGGHYDSKWNDNKETINANYKMSLLDVKGVKNTLNQNNLPTGIQNSTSDQDFVKSAFRQKADVSYFKKLDSTSTIKISVDGSVKHTENNDNFISKVLRPDSSLINNSTRSLSSDADGKAFNASIFYTKKFKKAGRTFSINLNESYSKNTANGYLQSKNNFFSASGQPDSSRTIDQYKTSNTVNSTLKANATYTEPLSKTFSLVMNYGINIINGSSDKRSFNQTAPGRYNQLDSLFSNDFELNQLTNEAGAIFNYQKDKNTINFGTRVTSVQFDQSDKFSNRKYTRDFFNWNPQAMYSYKFSQQQFVSLKYNGNTTQPQIDQIQPIRENTDPLNITLGNAGLNPSFAHNLSLSYNSFKMLTGQSLFVYSSFGLTSNAIVSNTSTDAAGKTVSQSVNLTGKMLADFSLGSRIGRKIKEFDADLGLNANGSTSYNYVNNALNTTKSYSLSPSLGISRYKLKAYYFRLSLDPSYSTGSSSLQQQVNNNGWTYHTSGMFNVFLPGKLEIGSDVGYTFVAATASFDKDFEQTELNAHISKKFFKSENLKLNISGNDLLNQNSGFSRNAYANQIVQSSYTTIKRYFLFSLTWDFNKMGGSKT